MPSIPLIGGPMDGGFWQHSPNPEIYLPIRGPNDDSFIDTFAVGPFPRIRLHTYRLSPCGRRYLHTSLVDQN